MILSSKYKFFITLLGIILLGISAWTFSIEKTLNISRENRVLTARLAKLDSYSNQISTIRKNIVDIERQIGKAPVEDLSEILTESITSYNKSNRDVIIKEIPQKHIFDIDQFRVESQRLVVSGSYKELLSLLLLFESDPTKGKVCSVNFKLKKDYRSNSEYLIMDVWLQTIRYR